MSNDGYRLVWEETCSNNGPIDRSKWDFDIGNGHNGWGNQEAQFYTDRQENVRYENRRLIIEARREDHSGQRFTSARIKSKSAWTYGRLQAKARLPHGRGLWPAIWMLPRNKSYGNAYWPDNGEIDIVEQVGYDPHTIVSTVHTGGFNHVKGNHPTHSVNVPDACDNFKIYTLNWRPEKIEMFVGDDNNQFQQQIFFWEKGRHNWEGWPFDKDFFVILNIAVGGTWGGSKGIDEGIFPKRMEIEWIRFYQSGNAQITPVHPRGGSVVALRSNANNKFVCADNFGNNPLIANRDNASDWEKFDLINIGGNQIALKSHANGKYVCAENGGNGPLIANRSEASGWETFRMIDRGNGKVALIACNGKYVCAEHYGNSALTANRDSADSWETFDLVR